MRLAAFTAASMVNQQIWSQEPDLRPWLYANRLDGFSKLVAHVQDTDTEKLAVLGRMRENTGPAMMKLQQFIAELDQSAQQGDAA